MTTELITRATALLLAGALSAGNVATTQALAHHQVAIARKAAAVDHATGRRDVAPASSVATLKALWR